MKKVYLMAVAALFGSASMAQVSVTFQVDMNGQTVSPNGVHVAGDWQDGLPGEDTGAGDWTAGANMMTDDNSDGIYELTVDLPAGEYQFKFINDNAWGEDEVVPAIVQTGSSANRFFVISDWHATNGGLTLPAVEFAGTAPAGEVAVRLQAGMDDVDISANGVHVSGSYSVAPFEPASDKMFNSGDANYVYIATVAENAAEFTYNFFNGDVFGESEWALSNPPVDCSSVSGTARTLDIGTEDITVPLVCFEACDQPCAQPSAVTLTVDMSNVSSLAAEIYAAGTFNGYSDQAMTDNGDGTYSLVLELAPDDYFFKFKNGSDGWENVPPPCQGEGSADRAFTVVEGEELIVASCFEQCTETCIANPDPAEIVFSVDMNAETVSEDGVYLISGFTTPTFQAGALEMTDDDADGIYEVTTLVEGSADIQFKFCNGDPFPGGVIDADVEEIHDFEADGCGAPNGIGGFNRTHTRSGEPEELGFVYNSCQSILSTTDLELGRVAIYPNPSEGVSFLEVENPNNHTLRMNIVDITGKTVTENMVINTTRFELNTTNLNSGLYFLNIVNERSERAVYKLMVQ